MHPENNLSGITLKESGRTMDTSPVQFLKALSPMTETESGREIDSRIIQALKALTPTDSKTPERVTEVKLRLLLNAEYPISLRELPE